MRALSVIIAALLMTLAGPVAAQDRPDPALVELLREAASDTDSFTDHFDA